MTLYTELSATDLKKELGNIKNAIKIASDTAHITEEMAQSAIEIASSADSSSSDNAECAACYVSDAADAAEDTAVVTACAIMFPDATGEDINAILELAASAYDNVASAADAAACTYKAAIA